MDQSARFALPFLAPGQTQKEWFHNEALQQIDLLLCAAVEGPPQADPPASPQVGQCYAVGSDATGAWTGQDAALAGFTDGGWRILPPVEGMRVLVRTTGEIMLYRNGAWETGVVRAAEIQVGGQVVLSARQPAIPEPSGGAATDAEARAAILAVIGALRAHGLIES